MKDKKPMDDNTKLELECIGSSDYMYADYSPHRYGNGKIMQVPYCTKHVKSCYYAGQVFDGKILCRGRQKLDDRLRGLDRAVVEAWANG